MHITITGAIGSGKSSTAKQLVKLLDADFISTGGMFRQFAEEKGLTVSDAVKNKSVFDELDVKIDGFLTSFKSDKLTVIDSRLAWFFVPDTFKVYLTCDTEVAALRLLNATDRVAQRYTTLDEAILDIKNRNELELTQWVSKYSIECNILHTHGYNALVDTTNLTVNETAIKIASLYEDYVKLQDTLEKKLSKRGVL